MVKKNGRLSVNDLYKVAYKHDQESTVEINGVTITAYWRIPFISMKEIVRKIADACFSDDGEYMPENREFATRMAFFNMYTNITLPQSIERMYDVVFDNNLYDVLREKVDMCQLDEINSAVSERIKACLAFNSEQSKSELRDVYDAIMQLQNDVTPLFENLTEEDVQNVISAIKDGAIDEKKIVDAYFDAKEVRAEEKDGAVEKA